MNVNDRVLLIRKNILESGYVVKNNNLLEEYLQLCIDNFNREKGLGVDRHHILPRSMFPKYIKLSVYPWNGVYLSYKDHLKAHLLLAAIFEGKMLLALNRLRAAKYMMLLDKDAESRFYELKEKQRQISEEMCRKIGSDPEIIRKRLEARKRNNNYKHSEAAKAKMSLSHTGKVLSESRKKAVSDKLKGRPKTEAHKRASGLGNKGKRRTLEQRQRMSQATIGKPGSLNPAAQIVHIFDSFDCLRFRCHGNFQQICEEHGLPKHTLARSYRKGGTRLYCGQGKPYRKDLLQQFSQFIGWYAKKVPQV